MGWRRVCRFIFLLACRTAREGVGLLVFDLDTYARVLDLTRREKGLDMLPPELFIRLPALSLKDSKATCQVIAPKLRDSSSSVVSKAESTARRVAPFDRRKSATSSNSTATARSNAVMPCPNRASMSTP